ncbi:paraquat-inducible protein A [Paraburkholderia silviterrae]|uniref:Paraquat-inducible protein A n=1 Tax=Paraburkholderia silviterrae TaxID=2528715 RepID=A0A4R5M890_9BURK|nr:paraquat-inducible protein A [Paraburkholderia silviterrae]
MAQDNLIACHECDALYHKPRLLGRQSARCTRCGATLYNSASSQLDRICAITIAALVTFVIAQSFPIIELDANGIISQSSLFGALIVLWNEGMEIVAVMVFFATILCPLTELVALLYVLLPIRRGYIPPGFNLVLRTIQFVRPWGMLEVFMLGVLITIVKMVSLARVIPETALFAFGALTLMITVVLTFDARTLWDVADALRESARAARRGGAGPAGSVTGSGGPGGPGGLDGSGGPHGVSGSAAHGLTRDVSDMSGTGLPGATSSHGGLDIDPVGALDPGVPAVLAEDVREASDAAGGADPASREDAPRPPDAIGPLASPEILDPAAPKQHGGSANAPGWTPQ